MNKGLTRRYFFGAVLMLAVFTVVQFGWAAISRAEFSSTPTVNPFPFGVNGSVNAMVKDGNTLYVGGGFSFAGRAAHSLALISKASGDSALDFADIPSTIYAAISDGSGGWYIGGEFTRVDSATRNHLAHILSDGTLDPNFDPNVNSSVATLVLDGSTLYAGGNFTEVNGGTTRNRIAAFDAATGVATSFDPNTNGSNSINSLVISGTTLYAGGDFTAVNGGTSRFHLAAFSTITGTATSFDAGITDGGTVSELLLNGTTLYVGGEFTTVNGGTTRNNLAAFNTGTGTATSFDPNMDGSINELVLDGSTLYAGGNFTTVNGGTTRNYLAAFNTGTSTATSFNPDVSSTVISLLLDGSTLYAGGSFVTVNQGTTPVTRNHLAAFDTSTSVVTSFDPSLSSLVYDLVNDGSNILAVGSFTIMNATAMNYLVAFDLTTGEPTAFNPNLDSDVNALVLDGSTLYAGGAFTTVNGGTTRNHLAAFNTSTGTATSFDPNVNGGVSALVLDGSTLYAGGTFNDVNSGTVRSYLAGFSTATGTATSFDASLAGGSVVSLALDGSTLYVGGSFTSVNSGTARNKLAAFNTVTSTATSFDPNLDTAPLSLLLDGSTLYAGGAFTTVNGGTTRNHLAAFNTGTSTATSFDPDVDSVVHALLLDGSTLYAGGDFTAANQGTTPITRNYLAAFDTSTGVATSFNPNLDSSVYALAQGSLYGGGEFTTSNGGGTTLASLVIFTSPIPTPTPAASGGSGCFGSLSVSAPASLSLFMDGSGMTSGATYVTTCMTHKITYTPATTQVIFSGDCSANGDIITTYGTTKTCTISLVASPIPTPSVSPTPPSDSAPREGDVISAPTANDPDVYIVNDRGYKRLFLNPIIFSFYGHLGGWSVVKSITASVRDSFITSGLFRNCETNDDKVYAVEVTAEDSGVLHHINISGSQAISEDPAFFNKVFCINSNEFNWYPKGSAYTSLGQVPVYRR